jgi:hypothetical protein
MKRILLLTLAILFLTTSCYHLKRSSGGGQRVDFDGERVINEADIALPQGYKIEVIATGLTFPTGIAFDEEGNAYITESGYSYGEIFTEPRLLKINTDGTTLTLATGNKNGPWNGLWYHNGFFYIAEGGQIEGGKIIRVDRQGGMTALIEGLPSQGDHHTNGPVVLNDFLYFGQGTATNSAVTGEDNYQFGWLKRFPVFHDIPCRDITLAGINYTTPSLFKEAGVDTTGAFLPYGTPSQPGQVIPGRIPCSGSVMRIPLNGGQLQLVAWGFRNPYGLAFDSNGTLYVTDNGYDERGSRPAWGTGDYFWKVEQDAWYGWPDYSGGNPINTAHYKVPRKGIPQRILANDPGIPPKAAAFFGVHSSSNGFDFSRSDEFGFTGEAFVAQFGDMAPGVGKTMKPVGFKVVRVNPHTGVVLDFAVNQKAHSPATKLNNGGLERPIAVRFSPTGNELYIVDFGIMLTSKEGPRAFKNTGVVWKVSRINTGD